MNPAALAGHAAELIAILRHDRRPADQVIDAFFRRRRYLGSHDRRELAESVYGVLRHQRCLQALITRVQADCNTHPHWLFAAYKIHFEKIPHEALAACKLVLTGAELHALAAHTPESFSPEEIGVRLSFPDWLVSALQQQMGKDQSEKLLEALNQPPPLTLRVNTLKTTRTDCMRELQERGLESFPTALSPVGIHLAKRANLFGLDLFREGWFELQDEGSQIISILLDPKPTWRIADVCAGGGGKTLHLAALMKNRGEIFAFDVAPRRLENLRKRARRAGAHNVRTQVLQSGEIPPQLAGQMDAILIDAPCSGIGVLRRNPDAKWKISAEMVQEMAVRQRQILQDYAVLVKPKGRLVYATCSLLAEENERVIESFLERHKDFQPAEAAAILQRHDLAKLAEGSFMHLSPHQHGCDGFFAAVLERVD